MKKLAAKRTKVLAPLPRLAAAWLVFAFAGTAGAVEPPDFVVPLTAEVQMSPPRINLHWPLDSFARSYVIYRKQMGASSWGDPIATLDSSFSGFADSQITMGTAYEYQVVEPTTTPPSGGGADGFYAYGYIATGIAAPAVESRGKIVLIVDQTYAAGLATELQTLNQDLVGDGWTVLRHDASPTLKPQDIKTIIQSDYASDPQNVRSVLLFGHVPVPYSGNINPDLHPNHIGAWPADAYYGDMDGTWTDSSVNSHQAEDPRNYNVPGDGKFDQSTIPADIKLMVGRVDLSQMTAFLPRTEKDLLRNYLVKNHNFRHGAMQADRRGLIRDNFGEVSGDAPAATAWRSFSALFGGQNITQIPTGSYFSTLAKQSFLWSYGGGGGEYDSADGVGTTTDFAKNDPRTVFLILHGSYFGDWDTEDNFLRAPLGTQTYCLASVWSGLPHWFLHPMGMGETIGYCTRLAQNNGPTGPYRNQVNLSTRQVHISLMGDPTLRLHVVPPPGNLSATTNQVVTLTWTASPDSNIKGYYIYRSDSPAGPYVRLTRATVAGTTYTDSTPSAQPRTYMVRALKLEQTASGSYYNLSQGIFRTVTGVSNPNFVSRIQSIEMTSEGRVTLHLSGQANGTFNVEGSDNFSSWTTLGTSRAGTDGQATFSLDNLTPGPRKFFRLVWPNSTQ